MAAQPRKYSSVRDFLDNLGNERIRICRNCNKVFSSTNENTILCISCDFEEEVQTLPSIVEIEENSMIPQETPPISEPILAEVDIVQIPQVNSVEETNDWDFEVEEEDEAPIVAETVEAEAVPTEEVGEAPLVPETVEPEAVVTEATVEEKESVIQNAVEAEAKAVENVEIAVEQKEEASIIVAEAQESVVKAEALYGEAIEKENQTAEIVEVALEAEEKASEAVVESSEIVNELIENEADETEIEDAVKQLEENIVEKEKSEGELVEAIEDKKGAIEAVKTASETHEEKAGKLDEAAVTKDEANKELEKAKEQEEKSKEETETVIEAISEGNTGINNEAPFDIGDKVNHGVYGNGKVAAILNVGKHWSVNVDFGSEQKAILSTFLTLKTSLEVDKNEKKEDEKEPVEKEKDEEIEEVVDYGEYEPGKKVKHEIFGLGEIKNCEPKDDNYRLMIKFDDNTYKTLLSTFVEIIEEDKENKNLETKTATPDTDKVVDVLDTDIVYRRPKKAEPIIDLSKPKVQDAEMVDEED